MVIKLNSRQQQVLAATIRHYVATAKPVGSESLLEEFNPRVSSATIRNAMGHLEKSGLLYQPHISAGRVPSDSGYRIYVDQLVIPSDAIARQADQILSEQLSWEEKSFETVLRGAAQILSTLSGYITLVTMPQTACMRHIQLVQIDPGRVMLIVVLDSYETQTHPPIHPSTRTPLLKNRLKGRKKGAGGIIGQHLDGRLGRSRGRRNRTDRDHAVEHTSNGCRLK